jgi:hypothetical protein
MFHRTPVIGTPRGCSRSGVRAPGRVATPTSRANRPARLSNEEDRISRRLAHAGRTSSGMSSSRIDRGRSISPRGEQRAKRQAHGQGDVLEQARREVSTERPFSTIHLIASSIHLIAAPRAEPLRAPRSRRPRSRPVSLASMPSSRATLGEGSIPGASARFGGRVPSPFAPLIWATGVGFARRGKAAVAPLVRCATCRVDSRCAIILPPNRFIRTMHGLPLCDLPYFRHASRGIMRSVVSRWCTRCEVTELAATRTSLQWEVSWT